jgi:hypothetical protein
LLRRVATWPRMHTGTISAVASAWWRSAPRPAPEIDEDIPALKKDTVTIIDDRDPETEAPTMGMWGKPFENRDSLDLELFLTRHWTHADPADTWTADAYRYIIEF